MCACVCASIRNILTERQNLSNHSNDKLETWLEKRDGREWGSFGNGLLIVAF